MKMVERTTLSVSPEVWREINKKKFVGDSVDDVLRRLLNLPENMKGA